MKYYDLGDQKISAVGLGTWQFGSREWNYGSDYASSMARAILERALELGVTLIDTAELYGFGESERIIGRVLGRQAKDVCVATKVWPVYASEKYFALHAKKSSERLQSSKIDLYQVHFRNPAFSNSSLSRALDGVVSRDLAGKFGISNFSRYDWEDLERKFGRPIYSNQVHYSLLHRRAEEEIIPFAQATKHLVIAYSPLEQGILSGKYSFDNRPRDIRRINKHFGIDAIERMQPLLIALAKIGAKYGASSAQIALAWIISHPNVVVIPGASSVSQLEANVGAGEIVLENGEIEELNERSYQYEQSAMMPILRTLRTRLGI